MNTSRILFGSVRRDQIGLSSGSGIQCQRRAQLSGIRYAQIGSGLPVVTGIRCERRATLSGVRRCQIMAPFVPPVPDSGGSTPKITYSYRFTRYKPGTNRAQKDDEDFLSLMILVASTLHKL